MEQEPLGLALSGDGFRATLFHLGVVRALRDADLLKSVKFISSVSGGSILAAHLVQNWQQYTATDVKKFVVVADEIVAFARRDVRNRIMHDFSVRSCASLPVTW